MDLLLSPDSHDMIFVNGGCPVTVAQQDIVAQRLKITLQTFLGEWFLDTDLGIPYFQQILTKVRNKSTVDAIFQKAILNDPGVLEMVSYESSLSAGDRGFALDFAVRANDGSIIPIDFTLYVGAQ